MLATLVLGTMLATPAAPIPVGADPAPVGPAPHVVYVKADFTGQVNLQIYKTQKVTLSRKVNSVENGKPIAKVVQEEVEQLYSIYVSLADIKPKLTTAGGLAVSTESVMRRAKDGLVLFISADGKPIGKAWLRVIDPDALIVTAEVLVGVGAPRATMPVLTQSPRLALLGTGTDGKVQVEHNAKSDALVHSGPDLELGFGRRMPALSDSRLSYPGPVLGPAPTKSLADVQFEAFDRTGKRVGLEDALNRLAAGGFALIASDNRLPDPQYLKIFRGELLVLVSPELVNVPTGGKHAGAAGAGVAPTPNKPMFIRR